MSAMPPPPAYHGYVAGIVTLATGARRLPGDPVHAETFDFPVCHSVVDGVTIGDLIRIDPAALEPTVAAAKALENRGAMFVATSCGLFAPYQAEIADRLDVPFIGSSLQAVSFLGSLVSRRKKICVITAHSGILTDEHVRTSGFSLDEVLLVGMQDYPEFARTVIHGEPGIDGRKIAAEARAAAESVQGQAGEIGLVVLECPNMISFRAEIQQALRLPVIDIVGLVDMLASALRLKTWPRRFVQPR